VTTPAFELRAASFLAKRQIQHLEIDSEGAGYMGASMSKADEEAIFSVVDAMIKSAIMP
jgi:hypothetical protein